MNKAQSLLSRFTTFQVNPLLFISQTQLQVIDSPSNCLTSPSITKVALMHNKSSVFKWSRLIQTTMDNPNSKRPGRDSPSLYFCYLSFLLVTFQWTTLLEEETVIEELDESQPWIPNASGIRAPTVRWKSAKFISTIFGICPIKKCSLLETEAR